jgi:flagellar M-ring protein FliF
MDDTIHRLSAPLLAIWRDLGRTQRILLVALASLLPVVIVVGFGWVWGGQYVPLFASLTPEDAGTIATQLKTLKVPHRIASNGEQILVPAERADEVRLRIASQGLPLGGGIGFEVFDRSTFGVSDFAQRLNYQRALQGELARTIGGLRGVTRARVHLVMPQPTLFAQGDRAATASVFLKLAPSTRLTAEQVRGIVHLVASSVEGLAPERVTVVDTAGRVLSVGGDPGGPGQLSPRRLEIRTAVEEGLERRVQTLLDSALGPGRAVTRVAAQLNFDMVERTEERFDPATVTKQESHSVESSRGNRGTGAPSAASAAAVGGGTSSENTREANSVTYEVSKIVARTLITPGEIQRLSVAVVLDIATRVTPPATADQKEQREPAPRTPEEIEKIRRVVMGAVGFTAARGDEVTVVEMPFDTSTLDRERQLLEQPTTAGLGQRLTSGPVIVALALVVVAVALAVALRARPRIAPGPIGVRITEQPAGAVAELEAPAPEPAPFLPIGPDEIIRATTAREELRQKAFALAENEPEAVAQLIRAWIVKKTPAVVAGDRDAN